MLGEELGQQQRVLVTGAFGGRRHAPVIEELGIAGVVEPDHGLGVADVDSEEHAA